VKLRVAAKSISNGKLRNRIHRYLLSIQRYEYTITVV